MNKTLLFAALCTATLPAHAVDGEILITQAKALAGNVTPGDAPGFPVTLSLPGKYKLAGSLTLQQDQSAIEFTAPDVALDLNGFKIQGPITCTGFGASLACGSGNVDTVAVNGHSITSATVRNGTIQGFNWGVYGVGYSSLVEDLNLRDIGATGIIASTGSIVRANRLYAVGSGIISGGLISGNTVLNARTTGISANYGDLVMGNQVYYTGHAGINAEGQGSAAIVHNAASISGNGIPINGGDSLGGGTHNSCGGNLC